MSISINIYIHGIHSNLGKKKRYNYNIQDESKNQDNLCKSKELSAANRIVIVSLLLLPLLTPHKAQLKELRGSVYPTPTMWFLLNSALLLLPTSLPLPYSQLPRCLQDSSLLRQVWPWTNPLGMLGHGMSHWFWRAFLGTAETTLSDWIAKSQASVEQGLSSAVPVWHRGTCGEGSSFNVAQGSL